MVTSMAGARKSLVGVERDVYSSTTSVLSTVLALFEHEHKEAVWLKRRP